MAKEEETDPRLEKVQEEVDELRRKLPHEPGFEVPHPEIHAIFPGDEEDEDEDTEITGTP